MGIAVLGPLEVNGTSHGLSRRDRVILAALVVNRGETVSPEALADALWGDAVPESWPKVVQGCVVRLRKVLGAHAIETVPDGYRLRVHAQDIDVERFDQLLGAARERLALGEPDRALFSLNQALALWRGHPLTDLENWAVGQAEAQRLQELHLEAEDLHTEAALRGGQHLAVLAAATRRLSEAPLRERRWALLAQTQYRAGRQGDALLTLRRARAMLAGELGLDPGPELVDLETAILNHDQRLNPEIPPAPPSDTCPYPGLPAYDVDDASTFFGRESDIAACLERLDATGVLAVVGPSGCGKSSLVRAGIAAALRADHRDVVVMTPGAQPLEGLVGLPRTHTALVVDQCEEMLAEGVDPADRAAFVDELVRHAEQSELVIALRADRLGPLAGYPAFARLVERGLYLLGGLKDTDLRAAIEGPARHAGLRLEPGLVDLLVREVEGRPGALPLLSHVLRQTWLRREGAALTVAAYNASGGVRQAVAQSAESLYERMPTAQRSLMRDLMLRLVSRDPAGEPTRTKVPRAQVSADPRRVALVEQLVRVRLVSADDATIEIAHEALAREWPRLQAWLDEDVEGLRILRHLSVTADSWEAMGRPESELYRGVRLARALEWRATNPALSRTETQFLDGSEQAAATEREATERQVARERRTNRRLRALLVTVAVFALVAMALGGFATTAARRAESQALAADARRVGAEALTAPRPDTSLLLAAAGMRLENNSDAAKSNLAAALDRSPLLTHVVRTPPAESIAVNPKTGQVAVSLASEGGVNLYSGRDLSLVTHTKQGGGAATAYSPDGTLLAAADTARDLNLAPDPQPIHVFDSHGKPWPVRLGGIPTRFRVFWSMAFSADGRWFAAPLFGYTGGRIDLTVWNTSDLRRPATVVRPDFFAHMTALALSGDGRTVYTTGDYYLRVWDVATGRQRAIRTGPQLGVAPLPFHDGGWTPQVVMSPDGHTLALVSENEVALIDPASLKPRARIAANGRIRSLAFSADSRRLVMTDGGVVVWDLVGRRPVHVFPSPDGDSPRPVQVFRAQTWGGDEAALSPDGNTVYAAGHDGDLLAWDLTGQSGFVTRRPGQPLTNDMLAVQVSDDARRVAYLANVLARVDVRDVATGRVTKGLYPNGGTTFGAALAWRPDGWAVLEAGGDYTVEIRDPSTGVLIVRRTFGDGVTAAQYTTDGQLVIGTDQGSVRVVDARTLQWKFGPLQPYVTGRVENLALDPAEHAVAIEGAAQRVLIDYRTGNRLRSLPYLTFFAPDGSTEAVVDTGGAVGFRADHGTTWIAAPDPSHAYGDVGSAYSHNSTLFASSRNGQVGLWNARTGTFLGSIPIAGQASVGFTKDDFTLVIAGLDGTVETWNLRPSAWIRAACDIAGRDLTSQEWSTALPGRTPEPVCASHSLGYRGS